MRVSPGTRRLFLASLLIQLTFATGAESVSSGQGELRSMSSDACNQAARDPMTWIDLPGHHPFQALPTRDGCWIFVSLASDTEPAAGVAVFKRQNGNVTLARIALIGESAHGMALTRDEKLLVVSDGTRVAFIDVPRLTSGHHDPVLGYWSDGSKRPGRVYVNITSDDQYLFISDELVRTISVVNLEKARAAGSAPAAEIGKIPVGYGPVALTFSPDGRYLYSTSQGMPAAPDWPGECVWTSTPQRMAQGAIFVIDVARAVTDPAKSVIAVVKAGCSPVRLVLSPNGDVAYVSARGEDALLAFDTRKLLTDSSAALIGKVPTGSAPVGVVVIDEGRRVVVANSNRFRAKPSESQSLTVIEANRFSAGKSAVAGIIPAGAVPREMRLTADQRTLLVVNSVSRQLQMIDLARLSQVMTAPSPQ